MTSKVHQLATDEFAYDLPSGLIAQSPLPDRDACRLLVLDRATGDVDHGTFRDLPELLHPDDLLVLNDSRVLPARLRGQKPAGGKVEVLLVRPVAGESWLALTRPGLRPGQIVTFGPELAARTDAVESDGLRVLRFNQGGASLDATVHQIGAMPIPPYIRQTLTHPDAYQTVFARDEGSVAAPTAGLHFTENLLGRLAERGVEIAFLTLHVGIGTFRPVKVERVAEHVMHAEWFRLAPAVAEQINRARARGRSVVAVGTTVVRTLESCADERGRVRPGEGDTSLFIVPGHYFRCVDALITNFHLPRSTLLMLVAAFAGRQNVRKAYDEAIAREYRFYSFGDAMLIR